MIVHILFALFFAYCTGRHDVPAVDNFTFYGSNKKHQSDFHRFNWLLKACYVTAISFTIVWYTKDWLTASLVGLSNTMIIWALFDPVIAIYRTIYTPPKKPWYYLSTGNNTDRFLLNAFGEKAGIYKFVGAMLITATTNILIAFL